MTLHAMEEEKQQLTDEGREIFSEGIGLVLSRWRALQMAVENQWGGIYSSHLADQLHSDIFYGFTLPSTEPLEVQNLENFLYSSLLLLNTEPQDGSHEEVAEKLIIMYKECLAGNYSSIERLRENPTVPRPPPSVQQVVDNEDDSMQIDNSSNVVVDVPRPRSNTNCTSMPEKRLVEPEDGWKVVSSRRRRN